MSPFNRRRRFPPKPTPSPPPPPPPGRAEARAAQSALEDTISFSAPMQLVLELAAEAHRVGMPFKQAIAQALTVQLRVLREMKT